MRLSHETLKSIKKENLRCILAYPLSSKNSIISHRLFVYYSSFVRLFDFTYWGLSNFDHKDIKIIAKRSNILLLSVFIYVFFKKGRFWQAKEVFLSYPIELGTTNYDRISHRKLTIGLLQSGKL